MREKINYIYRQATSPKAYSLYACIGVVVTTVLAIAATRKECKREEEKYPEGKIDITDPDELMEVVNGYVPTIIAAAATIGCIRKSDLEWQAYNGLITAGLATSQNRLAQYQTKVPGLVAATVLHGFGGGKAEEGLEWFCLKDLAPYNDIYFQSTRERVLEAEMHLNRNFTIRGTASVREFCAFLGILDQIDESADCYGWDVGTFCEDGLAPWIDFRHDSTVDPESGEVVNLISFIWEPEFTDDMHLLAYGYTLYPSE